MSLIDITKWNVQKSQDNDRGILGMDKGSPFDGGKGTHMKLFKGVTIDIPFNDTYASCNFSKGLQLCINSSSVKSLAMLKVLRSFLLIQGI